MSGHRRLAIPYPRAPFGACRWCGEPITKPDGSPNLRRNWHPECVDAYKMSWPNHARQRCYERDRGICAACRTDTHRTTVKRYGAVDIDWERRRWPELAGPASRVRFVVEAVFEHDHIVPLIDGGTHDLSNVQTLCGPCHKAKTKREAGERARRRRPQLDLMDALA